MLPITNEQRRLWREESKQITLTFDDGMVLTNEDIYYESLKLEQKICDNQALTFGLCNPSVFSIKIFNIPKSHKGGTVNVKISVGELTMDFGTYTVVEDSLSDDKQYRVIKAKDKLYEINNRDVSDWYKSIWAYDENGKSVPMTIKEFRDRFFLYLGVEQEEVELVNDNILTEQVILPQSMSGREVIESICEVNACFGQIGYDGKFRYVSLRTNGTALYPSDTLYPSNYLFPKDIVNEKLSASLFKQGSLKYEDYLCKKITQLQIRMEELDIGCTYGSEGNLYVIEDNFLLYGKLENELTQVAINFMSNLQFIEYNPLSVEVRAMPWLQVGDFLKVVNGRDTLYFPILERTLSGIQAFMDSYEAQGVESYGDNVNGIQSEILRLKGKSNVFERTIEETRSEITALDFKLENGYLTTEETRSAISQTASSINLTVENIQKQVNGQVNSYYGTEQPTLSNYPANQWNTDALKQQHNGDKYYVRDSSGTIREGYRFLQTNGVYAWERMSDTDVQQALQEALRAQAQVEELRSDVAITAKEIKATVSQSTGKWETDYAIDYNGYGEPNANAYIGSTNPLGKYYLDQYSGIVYKCTAYSNGVATWSNVGTARLVKDVIESHISQSADRITSTVAKNMTEWNTSDFVVSYAGYENPNNIYDKYTQMGGYYLNQSNGWIYEQLGVIEQQGFNWIEYFKWQKVGEAKAYRQEMQSQITQTANAITAEVTRASNSEESLSSRITQTANSISSEVTRATNAEGTLSSRITQTESNISSKVSKNSVISEINQSAEEIAINASKISLAGKMISLTSENITIASDKFNVTKEGSVTASDIRIVGGTGNTNYFESVIVISAPLYAKDYLSVSDSGSYDQRYNMFDCQGHAHIGGQLVVDGAKSRAVETENYGKRALYCYETPSPIFGDIGEGVTDENGECYIFLDSVFEETIEDVQYQVFLQSYGDGIAYVAERHRDYFVVKGTPNMAFGWEIKAKQKDYSMTRLESVDTLSEQPEIDLISDANYTLQMASMEDANLLDFDVFLEREV